jgi:hypothetical protein
VKIDGIVFLRNAEKQIIQRRGLMSQKKGVLGQTGMGMPRFATVLHF